MCGKKQEHPPFTLSYLDKECKSTPPKDKSPPVCLPDMLIILKPRMVANNQTSHLVS